MNFAQLVSDGVVSLHQEQEPQVLNVVIDRDVKSDGKSIEVQYPEVLDIGGMRTNLPMTRYRLYSVNVRAINRFDGHTYNFLNTGLGDNLDLASY